MKSSKSSRTFHPADLQDFFDHAPIGFHAFGPDRTIIDMNQTELDMIGYRKNEVIGKKSWADLIVPDEIPRFEQHWKDITTKGEVRNLNYTLVSKEGRQYQVLLNASARFDPSGKLINTRGSAVDISERYQLARRLSLSRQQLSRHKSALNKNNMLLMSLLDQLEIQRGQWQSVVQKNIEENIFPLLEKMKRRSNSLDGRNLVLLEKHLNDLNSEFSSKLMEKKWKLSAREMEICKMLKNGLKTRDIADLLSTSVRTIEHHRNHIRKKLGIDKPEVDLIEFLEKFSLS